MQRIYLLRPNEIYFPDLRHAIKNPNGLVAIGGSLAAPLLSYAYQRGIFPWFSKHDPILWWSPDPRAVLLPQHLKISRCVIRSARRNPFNITLNQQFDAVMDGCSEQRHDGTWITPAIKQAYRTLHQQGKAHSVEVWLEQRLVGGIYGVVQGGIFCGESMFSRVDNASKIALIAFVQHFVRYGGILIDCQVLNSHTERLGAMVIPRHEYLCYLQQLRQQPLAIGCWSPQNLTLTF